MTDYIDPNADLIDSRDVIERFEELDGQNNDANDPDALFPAEPLSDDEKAEHASLATLLQEVENNAGEEARFGVAIIADSYFGDYAQQLAEDIGAIPRNAGWPLAHIDWEAAAAALQVDYANIDWEGQEWWVRA